MKELTHISLFAGIGGIDLATKWAGFRTILFVEIDPFCQSVLRKHWPDVPIIGDIKDVKGEEYRETVTLISGGFPCQPVSQAGKRRGKADDRWLWPEMLRVISEVRPTWVVAENVDGIIHLGLKDVLADLEGEGYEVRVFNIPACGVYAPHRRNRIFIVANSNRQQWRGRHNGDEGRGIRALQAEGSSAGDKQKDVADTTKQPKRKQNKQADSESEDEEARQISSIRSKDVANSKRKSPRHGKRGRGEIRRSEQTAQYLPRWWAVEPDVGRVAYGIPNRVDRLKCLGNAVVPQQIYPILKAIADIERGINV